MRVHALQHVPHEGPGAIAEWVGARGHDLTVVRLDGGEPLPDPADVELLVVLGGPMGVYDDDTYPFLARERELIRAVHLGGRAGVRDDRGASGRDDGRTGGRDDGRTGGRDGGRAGDRNDGHVLGICLGAQQLAAALGAPVGPHGDSEVGWFPVSATDAAADSPLAPLGESYVPLHWHGDSFAVPDGATLLATSEACHTQAFAIAGSLGLQFHLEVRPVDVAGFLDAAGDWPEGPWVQSPERIAAGGDYEALNGGLFAALDRLVGDERAR